MPTSRDVTEKRHAEGGITFGSDRTEGGHLEHTAHRANFRFTYLWNTMKYELDGLLVERGDRELSSGDPAILVGGWKLLRQPLLDADDDLVQRCSQHGSGG